MNSIFDFYGEPISPQWAAEFRGFFFGDGFLGIVRNGFSKYTGEPNITPRAQITLRDDDFAVLLEVQSRLGGALNREPAKFKKQPTGVWRTRSRAEVKLVCDLLDGAVLPSKKMDEVKIMRQFLKLKLPPSRRCVGVDYAGILAERISLMAEMQRLHAYRPEAPR